MRYRKPDVLLAAIFGSIVAQNVYDKQPIALGANLLTALIWLYLTFLPIDRETAGLPTREDFLTELRHTSTSDLQPTKRECPICFETPDTMAKMACGHLFCLDCITRVFDSESTDYRCPYCRQPLFRMEAPWNYCLIKLAVCSTPSIFIETGLRAIQAFQHLGKLEMTWACAWQMVEVLNRCWSLKRQSRTLATEWSSFDRNGLAYWEMFWYRWMWLTYPIFAGSVIFAPGAIQELVNETFGI